MVGWKDYSLNFHRFPEETSLLKWHSIFSQFFFWWSFFSQGKQLTHIWPSESVWFWIRRVNYSPCPSISSLETLVRIGRIGFADESSDSNSHQIFSNLTDYPPGNEPTYPLKRIQKALLSRWFSELPVWWDMFSRSLEGHFSSPSQKYPPRRWEGGKWSWSRFRHFLVQL